MYSLVPVSITADVAENKLEVSAVHDIDVEDEPCGRACLQSIQRYVVGTRQQMKDRGKEDNV